MVFVVGIIILAGVGLMAAAMTNRRKLREMLHRERLAMIDRGLIPSPERDPAGFESATGMAGRKNEPGTRYRTAGVLMIGLGLGLMILITFTAGEPNVGIGVGGAWAILGAASLLNYFLITRQDSDLDHARWTPSARRPDPPSNAAP